MTESSPLANPFPTVLQPKASLFRLLVDAVRGVETDLTQAPLGRALLMLAVPMILEMIMVLSQSFNGAGDTRTPTLINLGVFWALQIPLAWLLSHHTGLRAYGVFVTLAVSFSVFAVVSVLAFRRGAWKRTRV